MHDITHKHRPGHQEPYKTPELALATRALAPPGRALRLLCLLCLCLLVTLSACGQNSGTTPGTALPNQASGLTYVAIGASDTFGTGTSDPYTQNWPTDLTALLKQPVHLINLGIPGMTLHDALTSELPVALDSHPALITIWLAVNDLAAHVPVSNYQHDLNTLLTRLQAASPHARIAVGNVPDLALTTFPQTYHVGLSILSQQSALYNAAIARVVASHHAALVDFSSQSYNLQEHPEYLSSDGLHPSDIGYLQVARLFYQALLRA